MCSFIGFTLNKKFDDNKVISEYLTGSEIETIINDLYICLSDKGGDYTKICFCFDGKTVEELQIEINELYDLSYRDSDLSNRLKTILKGASYGTSIFAFSRQTPETEMEKNIKLPPYKTIFGNYVAAHGTIPLKDFDMDIIDTEILRFDRTIEESLSKVEELNGKISIISYDIKNNAFFGIHNGLGLSIITYPNLFYGITTALSDTVLKSSILKEIEPNTLIKMDLNERMIYPDIDEEIVVSLCSGGMDALLSTTSYLIDNHFSYSLPTNKIKKIDIVYFDWDTRAKNQEIEAVNNFGKYLNDLNTERFELSNEVPIDIEIIEAKNYFKNILDFARIENPRLCSNEAVGLGTSEAEEAISYVPLRNTYLLLALVTKYEALYPNKKVTFIFGGNLTEGMVYSDNSVNYINKMNNLIKVAGQKTSNFSLVSPFSKMTKTNMLEFYKNQYGFENLEKLLNISFSCYFPIDNKPCGKCGSCLLREKSISRSISKYSGGNELNKLAEEVKN